MTKDNEKKIAELNEEKLLDENIEKLDDNDLEQVSGGHIELVGDETKLSTERSVVSNGITTSDGGHWA